MKKLFLLCVLLAVTSCAPSQREPSEVQAGEYDSLKASVTAHYSDRSVTFVLNCAFDGETASVTVTQPSEISGIVITVDENRAITYEGVSVEAGERNPQSPAETLPMLRSLWLNSEPIEVGYEKAGQTDCMVLTYKNGDALYRTWFANDTLRPVCAELIYNETRTQYCEFIQNEG